jgi:hypothetical protein
LLLVSSLAFGQTTQEQASSPSAITGTLPALLSKPLDSKKAKEGDPVICQTAGTFHDQTGRLITSGTKIIGHVTQAQARSKGDSQSSLAIVFDKVQLGKNEEVPIKGTLQAIGPALDISGPSSGGGSFGTTTGGSGSKLSGASGGTTAPPQPGVQGLPTGGGDVKALLTSQSKGAVGVKNLQMGDDSVVTSPGKEVKLDAGTQMMIHAQ